MKKSFLFLAFGFFMFGLPAFALCQPSAYSTAHSRIKTARRSIWNQDDLSSETNGNGGIAALALNHISASERWLNAQPLSFKFLAKHLKTSIGKDYRFTGGVLSIDEIPNSTAQEHGFKDTTPLYKITVLAHSDNPADGGGLGFYPSYFYYNGELGGANEKSCITGVGYYVGVEEHTTFHGDIKYYTVFVGDSLEVIPCK